MTKTLDRNSIAAIRAAIDAVESQKFHGLTQTTPPLAAAEADLEHLLAIHDQLIRADHNNELDWIRDVPGSEEVHRLLETLFARWLAVSDLACPGERSPEPPVAGSATHERLRMAMLDIRAALNPSYILSGRMLEIRDEAIAEYRRGEFLEGLVD